MAQPSHPLNEHTTTASVKSSAPVIMGETITLCRFEEGSRIEMTRHLLSSASTTLPLLELEEAVKSHFRYEESSTTTTKTTTTEKNGNDDDEKEDTKETTSTSTTGTPRDSCYYYASSPPLQIVTRLDAHWLECRRPYRLLTTVFGIEEEEEEEEVDANNNNNMDLPLVLNNPQVQVEVFQPSKVIMPRSEFPHHTHSDNHPSTTTNGSSNYHLPPPCSCQPPHRDWKLQDRSYATELGLSLPSTPAPPLIRWMDIRSWQQDHAKEPFLNSPAAVTHFLRSLLGTSHDASLWVSPDPPSTLSSSSSLSTTTTTPNVVALLMTHAPAQLLTFRVGDACPSYYLHSVAQLQHIPMDHAEWWRRRFDATSRSLGAPTASSGDATLLVYRQLSPRDQYSVCHPKDPVAFATPKGCLWETYYHFDDADNDDDDDDDDEKEEDAEEVNTDSNDSANVVATEKKSADDNEEEEEEERYRLLAPPYVSCDECYPGVLDPLLTPESMAILRREAMNIAHWTAWPEKQHYRSTNGDASNDNSGGSSAYPASWTVFPLCYCFPANDPSALKWIPKTCQMVPGTAELLQQHVGSTYLRTALFSRLDPETTLEPHIGWADLANHVLRVHIPLVVPPGGLCGTWVDGCVETHEEGRLICLDDGKLHRAFNYSQQPRIVLIVDLARPSMLPLGTATGGHSDELDQFIEQMGGSTS